MGAIGEMTLEDAAREATGNWRSWTCFVWDREREIDAPENWSIVYTHNRDSGLLDQSNADVIAYALKRFTTGTRRRSLREPRALQSGVDGFTFESGVTVGSRTRSALPYPLRATGRLPVLGENDYTEREQGHPRQRGGRLLATEEPV